MLVILTILTLIISSLPSHAGIDPNVTPEGKTLVALETFDKSKMESQAAKIIDFLKTYQKRHNFIPKVKLSHENPSVSARVKILGASDEKQKWIIWLYGGFMRFPGVTVDGLMSVFCHEAGHFVAGYPWARQGLHGELGRTSSEGEADYFAASVCLPRVWRSEQQMNQEFFNLSTSEERLHCAQVYTTPTDIGLCVRILRANINRFTTSLNAYDRSPLDSLGAPSLEVSHIFTAHPSPSCRLETIKRGVLCLSTYPTDNIPTFQMQDQLIEAQKISDSYYCENSAIAKRPSCWYQPPTAKYQDYLVGTGETLNGSSFLLADSGKVFHYGHDNLSKLKSRAKILSRDLELKELELASSREVSDTGVFQTTPLLSFKEFNEQGFTPFSKSQQSVYPGLEVEVVSFLSLGRFHCRVESFENGLWTLEPPCIVNPVKDLGAPIVLPGTKQVLGVVSKVKHSSDHSRTLFVEL